MNWEIVYNIISSAEQAVKIAEPVSGLVLKKKLESMRDFGWGTMESIPDEMIIRFQEATIDLLRGINVESERRIVSACASLEVIADRITHLCDSTLVA